VKLLFLDVDGVFNRNAWYKRYSDRNIPRPPLDRAAVRRLDRIIRSTGAHRPVDVLARSPGAFLLALGTRV
jgi:hypothetical protein